jgi:hypothetical protein
MITEDFVSYEVAKLLKEKGFDERICHYYDDEEFLHRNSDLYVCNSAELFDYISAPTPAMAMKWLREKYGLFIQIWILSEKGYWFNIDKIKDKVFNHKSLYSTGLNDIYFPTYEEATENAIKYCLENLI